MQLLNHYLVFMVITKPLLGFAYERHDGETALLLIDWNFEHET